MSACCFCCMCRRFIVSCYHMRMLPKSRDHFPNGSTTKHSSHIKSLTRRTYTALDPLNAVMKTVVPAKSAMRVKDVVKAVCKAGPCGKCEAMVLVTGRVCFGTYGGTLIDIPPVFGKSRYHKGEASKICISFCNGNKNHPLKQEAAARRLARRTPQTGHSLTH